MPRGGKRRWFGGDVVLAVVVCVLVCVGLIFVYGASRYTAETTYGNKYYYLVKQAIGAAVGVVAMIACANVPLEFVKKLWIKWRVIWPEAFPQSRRFLRRRHLLSVVAYPEKRSFFGFR